jgi:hypothetical protein
MNNETKIWFKLTEFLEIVLTHKKNTLHRKQDRYWTGFMTAANSSKMF